MVETVIEDGTKIEVFTMNETENLCASFFTLPCLNSCILLH